MKRIIKFLKGLYQRIKRFFIRRKITVCYHHCKDCYYYYGLGRGLGYCRLHRVQVTSYSCCGAWKKRKWPHIKPKWEG